MYWNVLGRVLLGTIKNFNQEGIISHFCGYYSTENVNNTNSTDLNYFQSVNCYNLSSYQVF